MSEFDCSREEYDRLMVVVDEAHFGTSGYFQEHVMDYSDDGLLWETKTVNRNIAMNRPYTAPFSTVLAPINSPESQLSIGAMLVKSGSGRFVSVF